MKTLPRLMLACAALTMLAGGLSGCAARALAGVQDHPTKPVVIVKTNEYNNFFFYQTSGTKFWLCEEKGDTLTCKEQCEIKLFGSGEDVVCPSVAYDIAGGRSTR